MDQVCKLNEIGENEGRGFVANIEGMKRNIFIVRKNGNIFAYLNWCPHNQVLIDQIPNKFFNHDKSYIQCSKHGALFEIEGGLCIEGPCIGEKLKMLETKIEGGNIYIV